MPHVVYGYTQSFDMKRCSRIDVRHIRLPGFIQPGCLFF